MPPSAESPIRTDCRDTVYIGRCGSEQPYAALDKRVAGEWVPAYRPRCPLILAPRIAVAPGAAHTSTLRVDAARPGRSLALPRFQVEPVDGTYRLVYRVYVDPEQGTAQPADDARLLPEERRVSNPFAIAIPRVF